MFLRDRTYKSGTGWCVWRWTEVDSEYIVRLHLVKTPWFAVCLHWIKKPDAEPFLHDHPVTFLSLILRGWYEELRDNLRLRAWWPEDPAVPTRVSRDWFNFIRARRDDKHRIIDCAPNTLTLAIMGPKTQEWGFHLPRGWVWWKDYYAAQRKLSAQDFKKWLEMGA